MVVLVLKARFAVMIKDGQQQHWFVRANPLFLPLSLSLVPLCRLSVSVSHHTRHLSLKKTPPPDLPVRPVK